MTVPTTPVRPSWRQRWANRQNDKRTRDYETALAAWQRDDDEAHRMLSAAQTYHGLPASQVPPYVDLGRGEVVYLVLPGVTLVETLDWPALSPPGYSTFSAYPTPVGPPFAGRIIDAGVAVITNKRISLVGNHRRDWHYTKMIGLAHVPDGRTTLMRVSNRVKVSGLAVEPSATPSFRFNAALAWADFVGERAAFVAYLEGQIDVHRGYRPQPPPVATPEQAPLTARVSPGILVAGAVAAILMLCAGIGLLGPHPTREAPERAQGNNTAGTRAQPTSLPAETPSLSAAPTTTAATTIPQPPPSITTTAPKTPAAKPSPRRTISTPKPRTVSFCGAPSNPYGYNYCGRGSRIYDPKPDVCAYFDCIDNFWNGVGYMIECNDGMVSMSGGRRGSCSHHGGNKRTVYDG
jgi:hypothetical protein